ncbi:MAG: tRNA-binding protein [Alphaproteobacteria bacterium]|nr:tRNA-binding protein [Alphaproteobacteria bacterium]
MEIITYDDFTKVELRSGTIVRAETFPEARKSAYKVWVDFGQFGTLQTSAQITEHYTPESLIGRQVMGCINLGVKKIAGFESQFLLVGFYDQENRVCLATTDSKVPNGMKLC